MFKCALVFLSIIAIPVGWASDPKPNSASAVVQLQAYLDRLQTFEADFRQTLAGGGTKSAEVSTGRVSLKKPGRFRWDYKQPAEQVIVSDGMNLWLYDADLEQVTVKSIGESLSTTPALLLTGKQNIADAYTISDNGARDGMNWMRLIPKRDDTDFTAIELGFSGNELRALQLSDKLGQTTRIDFSAIRRNGSLADSLFTFEPPAGADVIGKPRG